MSNNLFDALQQISQKPAPYSVYNSPSFWNDPYISQQVLNIHLNPKNDLFSRNADILTAETTWVNNHLNIGSDTRICDLGCGPGLYTFQWAKTKAQVTGVDVSEQSIAYAKQYAEQYGLEIEYICQNFLQFSSNKKFDLITMVFCIFCELNPQQRALLLNKIHTLLDDGGVFLLDVASVSAFKEKKEKETSFASSAFPCSAWAKFWSPEYHYLFTSCFKYDDEHLILDKYTVIEAERTLEVFIWLQHYSIETLKTEFAANGFEIIEHYADLSGKEYHKDSPTIAIIAKKLKK